MICFHGTNRENADAILSGGFKEGTYFALHQADAVKFGGDYVFQVEFDERRFNNVEDEEGTWWQFWTREIISPGQILSLEYLG